MQKSTGSMGHKKHRQAFKESGFSPKMRHNMRREAEKNYIKARKSTCVYSTVAEAIKGG